mgnify:CR=1 FL=1
MMAKAEGKGSLYLCATPIGNLEDITLRALRILKEVDLIAAEDTRHTQKLLNHFEIAKPLTSYFEHNKREKGPLLINMLLEGQDIALVTDAGTPGVSDPGADLVRLCIDADVSVVAIPGPSAMLSALVVAGLPTNKFSFYGFWPREKSGRDPFWTEVRKQRSTLIFYEAPHRLLKTLQAMVTVLGDRQAAAARELTKRYEEVVRGKLSDLLTHFTEQAPRGEFTLVIDGAAEEEIQKEDRAELPDPQDHVKQLMAEGVSKKEAIKKVAVIHNIPKREVYQRTLALDKDEQA